MIASDIRLYPMTMDVTGKRTHQQYVDEMAKMLINIHCNYRLEWEDFRKLIDYAEQNYERL